jgi:hypothetical protein
MNCQTYDLTIYQGANWFQELEYEEDGEPVDIENYTARMQVKKSYNLPVEIELTTANSRIAIVDVNKIQLTLSNTLTAGLGAGRYLYDIELVNNTNEVERILRGVFTVSPEVTK